MKRMDNKTAALEIIRKLRERGFEAYLVGGCVRDELIGQIAHEHDIATSARPQDVMQLFRKSRSVGAKFGVILVGLGGEWIEVASYRSDESYTDGRHPDSVRIGTLQEDAERRDFTINGIYLDPFDNRIIDLVGGREDIEHRQIRAIGNPQKRFTEDHLRMLRAVRFAGRLNFRIETQTAQAIQQQAKEITRISNERILDELGKILTSPGRVSCIRLTDELGLLEPILPEVYAMHNTRADSLAGTALEPDAFSQTLAVLDHLPADSPLEVSLAGLLHLVGTVRENPLRCRTPIRPRLNTGQWNYSAELANDVARRLTCSNQQRTDIFWLIQFLPIFGQAQTLRLAEIKRLKIYGQFDKLVALYRARTNAGLEPPQNLELVEQLARKVRPETLQEEPLVKGDDLKTEFGLYPGPAFQQILDEVYDAQLNEEVKNKSEALTRARQAAIQMGLICSP